MAAAKVAPTQEVLGDLFTSADKAVDFADCLWHATSSSSSGVADTGISAVIDDLASQLKVMRETLRDLVAWVG